MTCQGQPYHHLNISIFTSCIALYMLYHLYLKVGMHAFKLVNMHHVIQFFKKKYQNVIRLWSMSSRTFTHKDWVSNALQEMTVQLSCMTSTGLMEGLIWDVAIIDLPSCDQGHTSTSLLIKGWCQEGPRLYHWLTTKEWLDDKPQGCCSSRTKDRMGNLLARYPWEDSHFKAVQRSIYEGAAANSQSIIKDKKCEGWCDQWAYWCNAGIHIRNSLLLHLAQPKRCTARSSHPIMS